ncbi:L-serine ammonia-lyase [Carboxydocella sporoproducens DSM 16521]|uniref:L-serine deaminase n=2 Tax=Carboxydocella TaxID=178898 RepID=A0A1T4MYV0_9FIRM|nr:MULTISPECIES: L-serine ammonia-lyase, iron-sulfur-dependent subunit beta [Carboxydocella]AVX20273.1 L-serine ammonia-lyase [Carboxydocella thermautotrophica]AVX30696.1 L-serine ammonia-lyase [Carboxydocella thermautotrophica]SJZ72024.1 L-serine ammonia-lyase [Carboxydocella sporoproducens DSM 16521]
MNILDILGPVMIGPSSSHTAGAARIGRLAGIVLGEPPAAADFYLHGSFAETYQGHGTDRALVGGLLGFDTADERIRQSLELAAAAGISISFNRTDLGDVHPNTVKAMVKGKSGKTIDLVASSIGGGNIRVVELLGFPVDFSGQFHTIIIPHRDRPGLIAAVSSLLAERGINIAQMKVTREQRGAEAIMIIEADQSCPTELVEQLAAIPDIRDVITVRPL